ncbi:lipoprotein [Leptospira langatensis]|uniref:Lipoprotein n=1 Tax=Leptospira langatensis TaxID=2484983 RepID=A0A5F1ZRU8_9LEPT|nr:lipoprotein [Leptospira langatensis]TGJ98930.1 lipoprotein [Leptospira langatensis]TGL40502.1 lipoprotein [Leptospira langatensis]
MSIKTISTVLLVSLLVVCKTPQKEEPKTEPQKTVTQESVPTEDDQFVKAIEGFLNSSTYQVVVSSLDSNESEALDLAKKRALNLFIAEKGDLFRPTDRKVLKEIVDNKGKIVKVSKPIHGKTYYIFQVTERDLKMELKKQ